MTIFTIGHSNHEAPQFIALLRQHGVTAVADVRSAPHSARCPQYCRSALTDALRAAGIAYVFLGTALGGRPPASLLTREGYADYPRMAQQPAFLSGLARLKEGTSRYHLAIMCSEADPLDCHRALLIGRQIAANGNTVEHILNDGSIEPHSELESRLLEWARLAHEDLFTPLGERIAQAYEQRAARVAWREEAVEDGE